MRRIPSVGGGYLGEDGRPLDTIVRDGANDHSADAMWVPRFDRGVELPATRAGPHRGHGTQTSRCDLDSFNLGPVRPPWYETRRRVDVGDEVAALCQRRGHSSGDLLRRRPNGQRRNQPLDRSMDRVALGHICTVGSACRQGDGALSAWSAILFGPCRTLTPSSRPNRSGSCTTPTRITSAPGWRGPSRPPGVGRPAWPTSEKPPRIRSGRSRRPPRRREAPLSGAPRRNTVTMLRGRGPGRPALDERQAGAVLGVRDNARTAPLLVGADGPGGQRLISPS